MHSITIISATNRENSNTEKVANYYLSVLKSKGVKTELFSLKNLPETFLFSDLFGKRSIEFQKIIDTYIEQQTKFIYIVPEYNGSYPGVLKAMIDISDIKKSWWHKK